LPISDPLPAASSDSDASSSVASASSVASGSASSLASAIGAASAAASSSVPHAARPRTRAQLTASVVVERAGRINFSSGSGGYRWPRAGQAGIVEATEQLARGALHPAPAPPRTVRPETNVSAPDEAVGRVLQHARDVGQE